MNRMGNMSSGELPGGGRVTWLLPVKNGMPYIRQTLASVEAQTYHNQEMLVWENGSTDGTLEELGRWIPARIPGRVISDRPMPFGKSLAAAVEAAGTELCARIDADDVNLPTRLEKQVNYLANHPEVGLLGTRCEYIDGVGNVSPAYEFPIADACLRWQMRWMGCFHHPCTIFRRSVVLKAGNYRDCFPGDDFELFFRVARISEVHNLPEILVQVRKHAANSTVAIVDYGPIFDACAAMNADILFEGLTGAEAIDLRKKVEHVWASEPPVTPSDLFLLRKAATMTARAAGKPADYFRKTELYSLQRNCIVRRLLKQVPAGNSLLTLTRLFKGLVSCF
jgi:hypothetical protein